MNEMVTSNWIEVSYGDFEAKYLKSSKLLRFFSARTELLMHFAIAPNAFADDECLWLVLGEC